MPSTYLPQRLPEAERELLRPHGVTRLAQLVGADPDAVNAALRGRPVPAWLCERLLALARR